MARWKPYSGEEYYFVDMCRVEVNNYYWINDEADNILYNAGNVFQTEEEAERALEQIKELLVRLHGELKTREKYIDMLKHYATTGAKGVKTKTLAKVVESMAKDAMGEQ